MKIYIDSRAVGDYSHNTLVEIYVNGEIAKKGVLQMTEFCCVNLGDVSLDTLELKFFVIPKEEGNKYNKISKCDFKKVPGVLELDAFEEFREYDAETDLTIEDRFAPKTWIYAYSTKITEIKKQSDSLVFVFNENGIDGLSICEIQEQGYNVSYERIMDQNEISNSFKEWKLQWAKTGLITLAVSVVVFVLAVLLVCSFNWSPSSGKAQMALLTIIALIVLGAPNANTISALKDNMVLKKFLTNTDILDVDTFEKFKKEKQKKSVDKDETE